jgi:hypothetical protein
MSGYLGSRVFATLALAFSRDSDDDGLCKNKRLATIEAELDIPVIEHSPSRKAAGDELADIGHNERFGGASVSETGDCIALSPTGVVPPLPHP